MVSTAALRLRLRVPRQQEAPPISLRSLPLCVEEGVGEANSALEAPQSQAGTGSLNRPPLNPRSSSPIRHFNPRKGATIMDGITQALTAIQPELKAGTEVASLGSTAYNMYNQYQNQQYQTQLRSLAQDPAKMNAYAAKFTQPLTAGLQTGVANQAQADLASRGLTDSPEISQAVYAQAIAPYIQQQQNQGYQNALQALQVGGGAVNPNNNSPAAISALAKAFSNMPGGNGAAALKQLLQLGSGGPAPQTQSPDLGSSGSIPYQPTEGFDPSSFYQPDYGAAAGGDSGGGYGTGG